MYIILKRMYLTERINMAEKMVIFIEFINNIKYYIKDYNIYIYKTYYF